MSRRTGLLVAAMLGLTALAIVGLLNDPLDPVYVLPEFRSGYSAADIVIRVAIAWVYIGAGLVADSRRPASRVGLLMVGVGAALLVEGLLFLPIPAIVTVAIWLVGGWGGLAPILLGVLVLTYPSGRPGSFLDRAWISLAGIYMLLRFSLSLIVPLTSSKCAPDCRPLVTLTYSEDVRWAVGGWFDVGFAVVMGVLLVLVIRRWLNATPAARRVLLPVTAAGLILGSVVVTDYLYWWLAETDPRGVPPWQAFRLFLTDLSPAMQQILPFLGQVSLVAFPLALLWGLLRTRLGQSAIGQLALELKGEDTAAAPGRVREAVSRALGDPTLEIALWSRQGEGWIDEAGLPVQPAFDDPARAVTRLDASDGPVAVLVHDPALDDRSDLVAAVTAVAQLALENERLHAEVKAQLEEVRQSRERIVRAADDERRRVERNIHDGAQQRLVSLSLAIGMARAQASGSSPELAATLAEADVELRGAITELRELARGIHPAILTEAGLGPALESLADHAPMPVALTTDLDGRLPPVVEATAYFVAAEALTNVAKHANATAASLRAAVVDGDLRLEVSDNGHGGANPERGTGLRGMLDRVTALGGHLSVEARPGGGTLVRADIPCA